MASRPPNRQRLAVSWLMTIVGVGLLIWHQCDPTGQRLDGWTIAVVVLAFLPWLGPIFESITFPGGGVKYFAEQQARQDQDIKGLQFLVANFLTNKEIKYLRALAESDEYRFGRDDDGVEAKQALERLLELAFVRPMTKYNPDALVNSDGSEMKTFFAITKTGREYLKLRDSTPPS